MRILVTNDDGIYSPGLQALAEAARRFGEVRVVAPDVEQSSMGHAVTAGRPLKYRPAARGWLDGFEAYRVDGTPADCVALGGFHWDDVDVVLSGINLGLNLGNGIWHSGTVSAARQASLLGIQGIALSAPAEPAEPDYEALASHVHAALELVIGDPTLPLVNINFPLRPRGVSWTRQSVRHYDGRVVPGNDPKGRPHFWFTVIPLEGTDEDTDRWAIDHDLVSVTPLSLDLSDHRLLEAAAARSPTGNGSGGGT